MPTCRIHNVKYATYGDCYMCDREGLPTASSRSPGCSIAWSKNPPNEQADWWWWNEDEDSSPILVSILASCSGTGDRFFASVGQHGWNRPQWVEDMGGWWMKALIPEPPKQ